MPRLSAALSMRAAQARCGLLLPHQRLARAAWELPGRVNAAVPADPANDWQGPAGAMATTADDAIAGAIGEGLERLAAAQVRLPVRARRDLPAGATCLDTPHWALYSAGQRASAGFPWPLSDTPDDLYGEMFSLRDNAPAWVPQEMLGLGPRRGAARMPSTSSGLAAHADSRHGPWLALLRAAQELLERDALAASWLNGLGGRDIGTDPDLARQVQARAGEVHTFDLTQCWNPHPVVAVIGWLPAAGTPCFALGVACRATYAEARHKAELEWAQGLAFADHMQQYQRDTLPHEAAQLRHFDEHAAFYTLRPDLRAQIALIAHRHAVTPPAERQPPRGDAARLHALVHALHTAGVDLYYRELTTIDVAAAGLRVMRVASPQLSPLHGDERAPFLDGRCADISWRYPGARAHTAFPNPLPHPLG